MLRERRIAIVGMGTMGQALTRGLLHSESPARALRGTVRQAKSVTALEGLFDVPVGRDNPAAVRESDTVLVCTKPKRVREVMHELVAAGALEHDPLLISIAAGLSLSELERSTEGRSRWVRAMPNTPCLIGEGMTVITAGERAGSEDMDVAEHIFRSMGRVLRIDEEHMDTVTGLSASGPAFVYVMIEALSEGAVMMGLPRQTATELAAQMMQGAARMVLETGAHPAALKDQVTTPAGCTISALLTLEDGNIRSVLARGVQEAARAAKQLGNPS